MAANSTKTDSNPGAWNVLPEDVQFFEQHLKSFVPPSSFDAHGHFYQAQHLGPISPQMYLSTGPKDAGWNAYQESVRQWMGDRAPGGGLYFAMPLAGTEFQPSNEFVAQETKSCDSLRGLLLVRPDDDPGVAQQMLERTGMVGFKVYHVYAKRSETFHADIGEFLTEWMWELAQSKGLAIMLHMVKQDAIANPVNQQYIIDHCRKYPNAKLILAHCARSFCSGHALRGIRALAGLHNVYFDMSAVCEPQSMAEIIRWFGPTRFMFGLDWPVSQMRGRAISIADGFLWLYHDTLNWQDSKFAQPTLVGNESLLALKQACQQARCNDRDVEEIFGGAARRLFSIGDRPANSGQALYAQAKQIIPGGTQLFSKRPELFAPERWPAYFREARGCTVVDLDGRHYIDTSFMGIGACVLGYADPDVTDAVIRRVQFGSMATLNPPEEVELAQRLLALHPWAERVRFTRTGGESVAASVRIARAATGRQAIAICGYHGWHDWYLSANLAAGDRLDGHLLPGLDPRGVPRALGGLCLPFRFNQFDDLERVFRESPEPLAAVVMEPTRGVDPAPGFLQRARELCDAHGTQLVFDEISIGFKLALGGAHLKYGVAPDMAVFAKSLANGHPMAAIIGTQPSMEAAQDSFISSSYWTESVGPAAALATLEKMSRVGLIEHLQTTGQGFKDCWTRVAKRHGLEISVDGHNCLPGFQFKGQDPLALETLFTARMLEAGYLATTRVHVSLAHRAEHLAAYETAIDGVFAELAHAIRLSDARQRLKTPVRQPSFARLT